MSKRKAATAPKPGLGVKITAKAQRAKSAIIRSPKTSRVRAAADQVKSSPKGHNDPKQDVATIESPTMALQDSLKQTMRAPESKNGLDFYYSATATARAYQAKLLEMAQANMQFALELTQRLATIRSPMELLRVIEEATNERIAMFRKYSNEMVELSLKR
jgi:hypothetical protein